MTETEMLSEQEVADLDAAPELATPQNVSALCQTVRALRARVRELEDLAYIGEHHHPDLTWKSRALEHYTENIALREQLTEAEGGLLEIGNYLDRHFVGRTGRRMTWQEVIEHIGVIVNEKEDAQEQLAQVEKERDVEACTWRLDPETDYWQSACGTTYFNEDDPVAIHKGVLFCHGCGKRISLKTL